MKRLFYAYLIGLLTCFLTIAIVSRMGARYVSVLYMALLGLSSTAGDIVHQHVGFGYQILAAGLLSCFFLLAEFFRTRDSWLRWFGFGLWLLLIVASLWWFLPPPI